MARTPIEKAPTMPKEAVAKEAPESASSEDAAVVELELELLEELPVAVGEGEPDLVAEVEVLESVIRAVYPLALQWVVKLSWAALRLPDAQCDSRQGDMFLEEQTAL